MADFVVEILRRAYARLRMTATTTRAASTLPRKTPTKPRKFTGLKTGHYKNAEYVLREAADPDAGGRWLAEVKRAARGAKRECFVVLLAGDSDLCARM